MAHFAMVTGNTVQKVIVIANNMMVDDAGCESETVGKQYCAALFGTLPDIWIQCSYNADKNGFRGCFPSSGYSWDGSVFTAPIIDVP